MNIYGLALNNLLRRPWRSLLTMFAVALAVVGYVSLTGISRGVDASWTGSLLQRGAHLIGLRRDSLSPLLDTLDESIGADIAAEAGIDRVDPELIYVQQLENGNPVMLVGWEATSALWKQVELDAGRMPAMGSAELLLGPAVSMDSEIGPGGEFELAGRTFTVSGIARPVSVLDDNTVHMLLDRLQDLTKRQGQASHFMVMLENPHDAELAIRRLEQSFPTLRFIETRNVAEQNEVLALLRAFAWSTSLVAISMGLLIVLNTMLMSVMERRRDIGILVAVGWPRARIFALIVFEGALLGMLGGILGTSLGSIVLNLMANTPIIRETIDPQVAPWMLLALVIAVTALGMVGSILPAWRAVNMDPIQALRYE